MQPELREAIERRRGRAIKTIMRAAERDLFPELDRVRDPDSVEDAFRRVVLEELNDLTALFFDVLHSVEGAGVILNGAYLDMLQEIHTQITADGQE